MTLFRYSCACVCLTLAPGGGRALSAPAGSTAMFRGDAHHSGVYPGAPAQFRLKWYFQTRGKIRSTAAVAGGLVCFGSEDGNIYAVDASTGKLRWKHSGEGDVSASPAIAGNTVYAVDGTGNLLALALDSGKLRWQVGIGPALPFHPFGNDPRNWDLWLSSPVVEGERVYFGGADGALYAVDRQSGAVAWKYATKAVIRATPAISNGTVYSGGFDGKLVALDASDGKPKWTFRTGGNAIFTGEIHGSPSVDEGRVFFGARDGFLYALDAATGKELWKSDHKGSWVPTSPAVSGGVVYAGSSDGKFIQAVEAASGKEKWRFDAGLRVFSSPIISGNRLIAGLTDGSLVVLDVATGKEIQRAGVQYSIYSSPVVADGVLYIGGDDSTMYAFGPSPVESYKAVSVAPSILARYAGEYELSPMKFELALDGQKLVMKMGGSMPLEAVSEKHFFNRERDIEIIFEDGGKAKLSQGGMTFDLKRTK